MHFNEIIIQKYKKVIDKNWFEYAVCKTAAIFSGLSVFKLNQLHNG